MLPNRETLLCRYHYDPLDRLIDCTPSAHGTTRRFYLKDRLTTEIQGAVQRSIMQHDDQLLAQQQRQSGVVDTRLLATDQQRSVLNVLDATRLNPLAYSPYGHRPPENGLLSLLGFNGERPDPVTGCYLLGNGYRAFNPVLMRFNSPDSWSPFGKGGLNAYAYCVGDPVNRMDPTGRAGFMGKLKFIGRKLGFRQSSRATRANQTYEAATSSPESSVPTTGNRESVEPPTAYSDETPANVSGSRASQEYEAPAPYSRNEFHREPPSFSPGNGVTPLAASVPPPPSYFMDQRGLVDSSQIDTLWENRRGLLELSGIFPNDRNLLIKIDNMTRQINALRWGQ